MEDNPTVEDETKQGSRSPNYPFSLGEEYVEILLRCSDLETIIDIAMGIKMTLIYEQVISSVQSCTDGTPLSRMKFAVSNAVRIAVADVIRHYMLSKMVKEEIAQLSKHL